MADNEKKKPRKKSIQDESAKAMIAGLLGIAVNAPFTGAANAQTSDQRVSSLEEIVVTARKREESLQDAPLSISATSGGTLEKAQIRRIDEIGQFAPAVTISETVGYGATVNVYIRGIGNGEPILTGDSPVALYVDGVYLGRTAAAVSALVDVDRVEVLRGPQGTLFGRNTTGGAISLFTKGPSENFGVRQDLSYASNNELTSTTTLNTGSIAGSPIFAKISYQHHQMDGYWRNTLTSPKNSQGADITDQLFVAVHAEPTENFTVDYKYDYRSQTNVPTRFQVVDASPATIAYFANSPNLGGAPSTPPFADRLDSYQSFNLQHAKLKVSGHSLTLNYFVSDALKFKSISAYRQLYTNSGQELAGAGQMRGFASVCPPSAACPVPQTVQNVYRYYDPYDHQNQYQRSQELQVLGKIGDLDYVVGLYYFDEHVGEESPAFLTLPLTQAGFPNIAPFNTQALSISQMLKYSGSALSRAAFTQVSWSPSAFDNKLELTGGLRYTQDRKTLDQLPPDTTVVGGRRLRAKFHDFSQSGSVKYQWTPDIMTFVRFSKAYKAGGFSARSVVNGDSPQGAYKPEKATSYEAGVKAELWGRKIRLNAAVYQTDYKDLQVQTQFAGTGGFVTQTYNAASARYRGGEAELTVLPATGWQLNASVGYVDPTYQKYIVTVPAAPGSAVGVPIDISRLARFGQTAKTTASASLQYEFPATSVGKLTMRADWAYLGPRYFVQGSFQNGSPSGTAATKTYPGLNYITVDAKAAAWNNVGAQIILDDVPIGLGAKWTLTLFGKNLLNEHQKVGTVDLGSLGFVVSGWGRGRIFGASASAKF